MTPDQFCPLAKKYGLPVPWLAKHVGHVQERTMRYWVYGRPGVKTTVPEDVVERMQQLNSALDAVFDAVLFK